VKKILFISILIVVVAVVAFFSLRAGKVAPEKAIEQNLLVQIDSFTNLKARMLTKNNYSNYLRIPGWLIRNLNGPLNIISL